MTSLHVFTTWSVGFLNGCAGDKYDIPNTLKYGTIALASGIQIIQNVGTKLSTMPVRYPGTIMAGLFVGIPAMMGSIFCTGHMLGATVRYLEDEEGKGPQKNGVSFRITPS